MQTCVITSYPIALERCGPREVGGNAHAALLIHSVLQEQSSCGTCSLCVPGVLCISISLRLGTSTPSQRLMQGSWYNSHYVIDCTFFSMLFFSHDSLREETLMRNALHIITDIMSNPLSRLLTWQLTKQFILRSTVIFKALLILITKMQCYSCIYGHGH